MTECICDMHQLMWGGCNCGYLTKNTEVKNRLFKMTWCDKPPMYYYMDVEEKQ